MTDFRNASINLKLLSDTRNSFAHSLLFLCNDFIWNKPSTLYGSLWRSLATIFISLYFIKKNNNEITPLNQIQNLFWLSVRSFGQLVALVSYITAASYLRVGAVSSLTSTSPVVVLILSTIILKEKFYMRYVYGIIVCMIGTLLIISNERGKKHTADEELDSLDRADRFTHFIEIIIGVLWGIVNLVVVAM
jgi:drug/metabolite transporter (DMT)-like permease